MQRLCEKEGIHIRWMAALWRPYHARLQQLNND